MYKNYNDGMIEVITGPMFSGKTEELIRRIKLLEHVNIKTLVIKPKIDNRWNLDKNKIFSRSGSFIEVIEVASSKEIWNVWNSSYKVIAIDEAQFFDKELAKTITKLANKKVRVLISGLEQDFEGKPFGFMPQILAIAEHVDKLSAICTVCGLAASITFRKNNSTNQIEIGDKEYDARCRSCHYKGQLEKK